MSAKTKIFTAAAIIIGNEILSGRTQDKNVKYMAEKLGGVGVRLAEVRIIPDIEGTIVQTINDMRAQVDYVFTSGGIGPTHDDITAESIAKAFSVPLVQNQEAYDILLSHYKKKEELTEARLKMAMIPEGAELISNPVSGAPGFNIGNVYVLAGVPRIMQAMLDSVVPTLKGGALVLSKTVEAPFPESKIADALGTIQKKFPDIDIGSYPQYIEGKHAVNVVLRSIDQAIIEQAKSEVQALIDSLLST